MALVWLFADVLLRFAPHRLVTEWFITINAAICTVLVASATPPALRRAVPDGQDAAYAPWVRRATAAGVAGALLIFICGMGWKRALCVRQNSNSGLPRIELNSPER